MRTLFSFLVLVLCVIAYKPLAQANTVQLIKYNVRDKGPFVIHIEIGKPTLLAMSAPIRMAYFDQANVPKIDLSLTPFSYDILLTPKPGAFSSALTVTTTEYTVDISVHVLPTPTPKTTGQTARLLNRAQPSPQRMDRVEFYDGDALARQFARVTEAEQDRAASGFVFENKRKYRVAHEPVRGNQSVRIRHIKVIPLPGRYVINFELKNRNLPELFLGTVKLIGDADKTDYARTVQVKNGERVTDPWTLVQIPPDRTVLVNIVVGDLAPIGSTALLDVVATGGMTLTSLRLSLLEPISENQGRVSIQAQGFAGATSLRLADQSKFTTVLGFGARAVYGIAGPLSIEGSLSRLSATEVEFSETSKVEATIYRGLLGVALNLGDSQYIPYLRAGIGARLTDYKATSAQDELLDSSLLWFGGGVEAWSTDAFVIGVSFQVVSPIGGDDADQGSSFEATAHAGFAWNVDD